MVALDKEPRKRRKLRMHQACCLLARAGAVVCVPLPNFGGTPERWTAGGVALHPPERGLVTSKVLTSTMAGHFGSRPVATKLSKKEQRRAHSAL